jgi:hypothetical protein
VPLSLMDYPMGVAKPRDTTKVYHLGRSRSLTLCGDLIQRAKKRDCCRVRDRTGLAATHCSRPHPAAILAQGRWPVLPVERVILVKAL